MPKTALKKEKWTLSFDSHLKNLVIKEARRKGIYPVALLEEVIRDRYNPYGFSDVKDSVKYVRKIRKGSRKKTDEVFLKEIQTWKKSNS